MGQPQKDLVLVISVLDLSPPKHSGFGRSRISRKRGSFVAFKAFLAQQGVVLSREPVLGIARHALLCGGTNP